VEGEGHGHRQAAQAQGERQGPPCHAPGQDAQDLRQPPRSVAISSDFPPTVLDSPPIALLLRVDSGQDLTVVALVLCAVISTTKMQEHAGSDKSRVWHAADFADGELKDEMFAIRFGSVESEFSALLPRLAHDAISVLCGLLGWITITCYITMSVPCPCYQ
jgi:hypothetical protein